MNGERQAWITTTLANRVDVSRRKSAYIVDLVSLCWRMRWIIGSVSLCLSVFIHFFTAYARWQHGYYNTLDGGTVVPLLSCFRRAPEHRVMIVIHGWLDELC